MTTPPDHGRTDLGPADHDGPTADHAGDAVLDRVRGLYQAADPVPSVLYTRIRFALDLADADRELAAVCADLQPAATVRGPEQARTVTFEAETITITITVTPGEDAVSRLDGWLLPAVRLQVELRTAGRCHRTSSDDNGRFVFEDVGPGEAQLAVLPTTTGPVALPRVVVTQPIVL